MHERQKVGIVDPCAAIRRGIMLLCALAFSITTAAGARAQTNQTLSFDQHVRPVLEIYCFDCHGDGTAKGGLAFDNFKTEASIGNNIETWLDVVEMVGSFQMPPSDELQPEPDERHALVEYINRIVAQKLCGGPPDPGRVTIRRLNKTEYRNTIRDLTGLEIDASVDLPADDIGYGFDNIGDVLSLSPLLMERYLSATERVLDRAIVTEDVGGTRRYAPDEFQREGNGDGGFLTTNGSVWIDHRVEHPGEYRITVTAWQTRAGREPAKMTLRAGNTPPQEFNVIAQQNRPMQIEHSIRFTTGSQRIEAAFTNDFYQERPQQDRNLMVESISIEGPIGSRNDLLPESHRKIVVVDPESSRMSETRAAQTVIATFAQRAFRRPLDDTELRRYLDLFRRAKLQRLTFEQSIQVALTGILVSPHFLFKVEAEQEPEDPGQPQSGWAISDYELATRLSYFLWSSMPDDELMRIAGKGELRNPQILEKQVLRMLADDRIKTGLVENFAGQWLQVRNLASATPDPDVFPGFSDSLRTAMARETNLFFESIIRDDRNILDLLDADFTYLNEELARHYGIDGVAGDQFRLVLLDDARRGGVLTQASFLTITSNPTRTSPVKRGKWVMEQILGTPPPLPPANVPPLEEEESAVDPSAPLRKKMEQHRADPNCAVCHIKMDAIGFAFENFDAVGRWRDQDGRFEIEPAGKLPDGRDFADAIDLKGILLEDADQFTRNLTRQMLTYALGRGLEFYDRCATDDIVAEVQGQNYRFSSLVLAIVQSDPFQRRRAADTHAD